MRKKHIITGAPGTGKTSIIKELQAKGFNCVNEQSRELIAHQIKNNGDILPWKNQLAFEDQISKMRTEKYLSVSKNSISFFDRSPVDCIAYLRLSELKISPKIINNIKQCLFNNNVFYTPIWEKIFTKDKERKEDLKQAKKIEKEIIKTYESLGYKLIEIPKISVTERIDFILSKI